MTATLNAQARFETLVVGAGNRLAVTAARAVAEAPGSVYNPLFVYARPGLGKTHLLMAIGHQVKAINPGLAVEYLTLDAFVESFTTAVASGQGEAYRRRFTEVGLLLVDDVQFLTHRREMQSELLRIVDALQAAGRQIVLTSDRPPAEIAALDERLIRRFGGGLIIDIGEPDYETRVAILRRKAEERGTVFAPGVLEAVAGLGIDNVRELVGALNRLVAFQAVSDAPLDARQAVILVGGAAGRDEEGEMSAAAPAAPASGDVPVPEVGPTDATLSEEPSLPSPSGPSAGLADEFGDFLSEVAATVAQQVESWRTQVGAAILRWEGEGYRTQRLDALLEQDEVPDPDAALRAYAADVARLQALEADAVQLAPELAGHAAFRDPADVAAAEALLERTRAATTPPPPPSPLWRLEEIVEGRGNRMAVRATHAVAEEPGTKYNPLVLIGGPGSGKTHLLHGLGNALAAPGGVVACLGAGEFTSELIEAIDQNSVPAWQARYRRVQAFLLDDVHLLGGKDRTQEELFTLFNLLLAAGRQMVFTAAAPLAALEGIEPRLLTRLEGGLVVELPAPDREVRQQLVERLLAAKGVTADPELAAYVASRPAESARAVQGLVQRVLNAAEAQQTAPTAALARELLEGPARTPRRPGGRTSGVVASTGGGVRSREKMVWDWPDVADRMVEEWR
ncbi:MAG TPA: DnaA/Hda family protein [Gemmatimonadales bacterium]|nr:DnaA/Hda family protein [Gemmatimonadales bacterium]